MLKHFIIRNLHSLLGFEDYLFTFTIFKISTLSLYKKKKAFIYFTKLFPKDANIIVIGANTGITTIPIAKNVPEGKVFAIEPIPDNLKTLQRVIKYYKLFHIDPINVALGNENKEIEMVMPIVAKTKSHGLCHIDDKNIRETKVGIKFKVQMKKLDDIFSSFEGKIDGIKIVTGNYEWFIFDGGKELIAKHRPLMYCELWFNDNKQEVLELIKSWNYEIKVLEGKKLVQYNSQQHFKVCFFFVPNG